MDNVFVMRKHIDISKLNLTEREDEMVSDYMAAMDLSSLCVYIWDDNDDLTKLYRINPVEVMLRNKLIELGAEYNEVIWIDMGW